MKWINFLHLYQPAHTDARVIEEATIKSYERIVRALEEHPRIKFTMNISGCLFLRWEELNYFDLIIRIRNLLERKQIELTGSAAYHPILPLIPHKEAVLQIKENEAILKKHFGENFKPKGFFLPEMAYSPQAAKIIKSLGYEWVILDEIAFNGKLNQADTAKIYTGEYSKLSIIFRDRLISQNYVPDFLKEVISGRKSIDRETLVTATDGELYGLRHEDPTGEFEKLLNAPQIETSLISEYINSIGERRKFKPVNCNWESTEEELRQGKSYALWFDKGNRIQQKIWELANLAYELSEKYKKDKFYHWSRWHLVRGFSSCTFWWASARDFKLFGSISWSPDEIERGINEFIRSIRALDDIKMRETKVKAEKLYLKIKQMVWEKHWRYYWKK